MTFKVCYWDNEAKEQRERDSTPEEDMQRAIDIASSAIPTIEQYTVAIQDMLDAKVLERRYYNILSACTYATSTNATFNAEGQACVSWRDAVWAKAYDVLAQVEAKALEQPTVPELLAMLPALTWPA